MKKKQEDNKRQSDYHYNHQSVALKRDS